MRSYKNLTKRSFDIFAALFILTILFFPYITIFVLVALTSDGSVIYWSNRVGKDNKIFRMPKFRTMRVGTPIVATHLLNNPDTYLTPFGKFLRKSSLDELPQLWCILIGDMSIVGPRPALYNQNDLIELRTKAGVHSLLPGLTGLAQINGRDDLSIEQKVAYDAKYMSEQSVVLDIKIIHKTIMAVLFRTGISH